MTMENDIKQLRAQVEAQSCVINNLLVACMRHGIIDPHTLADECRERGAGSTRFTAQPQTVGLLHKELDAWANLIIDQHHADASLQDG